jgi:RNA polymerase sigma-70 factor, ECF subfamily
MERTDRDVGCDLPAAQAGDSEALGRVLEIYRRYLLWVARRSIDPDLSAKGGPSDLVQDTLLEAYRDFADFRGTSEADFLSWLRRLLLNNVANFTRNFRDTAKRRLDGEQSLEALGTGCVEGLSGQTVPPPDAVSAREQSDILQRAIAVLPEEQRRVVLLWYVEGLSFEEIGRRLECPSSTIRSRWYESLRKLQQHLEARLPDGD